MKIEVTSVAEAVADADHEVDDIYSEWNGTTICSALSETECLMPLIAKRLKISVPIYGYISPPVILLTIITNSLICVVLLRRNMRTATNLLLTAIALSDMLTGLCPLPCFVYFYTLGANRDWMPHSWCVAYNTLIDNLPTVFHTASIWLTVALAVHRYICVCKPQVWSSAILTITVNYSYSNHMSSGGRHWLQLHASDKRRKLYSILSPMQLITSTDPVNLSINGHNS